MAYASMTWTTPFETSTLGLMTLALLTKTVPLETVMVRVCPFMAVSLVPFMRLELYPTAPLLPVLLTTEETISVRLALHDQKMQDTYRGIQGCQTVGLWSSLKERTRWLGKQHCSVRRRSDRKRYQLDRPKKCSRALHRPTSDWQLRRLWRCFEEEPGRYR